MNLQTADTVILFDSEWNPQLDRQAESRAHRIGQTREVLVVRLVTATEMEEHILETGRTKLDAERQVIHMGKFDHSNDALESSNTDSQLRLQLVRLG